MRGVALLLIGCGFEHGVLPRDGSVDAPDASMINPDAPDAPPAMATCNTSDPALVLCLEFDEDGLATATSAKDTSGRHHDPTISAITLTSRSVPASSRAITTSSASTMTLPKPTDFNLQAFTLSAWVKRGALDPR